MSNAADTARAEALGRLAARAGQSLSTCPYKPSQPDGRILRARWAMAYAAAVSASKPTPSRAT